MIFYFKQTGEFQCWWLSRLEGTLAKGYLGFVGLVWVITRGLGIGA